MRACASASNAVGYDVAQRIVNHYDVCRLRVRAMKSAQPWRDDLTCVRPQFDDAEGAARLTAAALWGAGPRSGDVVTCSREASME